MGNGFSQLGYILFFQHQEIKRALYQSASALFLIVWEEVSGFFIDYLSNCTSSPFLKMLSVFSRKKYQADVGNISRICLLGKLCQLS